MNPPGRQAALEIKDFDLNTPLDYAVYHRHKEIVAVISTAYLGDKERLFAFTVRRSYRIPQLHSAVFSGSPPILGVMLKSLTTPAAFLAALNSIDDDNNFLWELSLNNKACKQVILEIVQFPWDLSVNQVELDFNQEVFKSILECYSPTTFAKRS